MNPWITGRIIETMQQEARDRGTVSRTGHAAVLARRQTPASEASAPRRARIGYAVARLGLRIAGSDGAVIRLRPPGPAREALR